MSYQVIYADPPWRYDFSGTHSRAIEAKYPTMSLGELQALKFPCAENAVLYLWATAPKLIEALEIMKVWGFNYKTHAVWDKERFGSGYWFRGQHELLLVGVKGQFRPPPESQRISSVIRITRGDHSSKPDQIRDMIKNWFPEANRLELFARKWTSFWPIPEGWDVWGNEAGKIEEMQAQSEIK